MNRIQVSIDLLLMIVLVLAAAALIWTRQRLKKMRNQIEEERARHGKILRKIGEQMQAPLEKLTQLVKQQLDVSTGTSSVSISPHVSMWAKQLSEPLSEMRRSTGALTTFSKLDPETVTGEFPKQTISPRIFFADIVNEFAMRKPDGLELSLHVDRNTPDLVNVAAGALRFEIDELIENALQNTRSGRIEIWVSYADAVSAESGPSLLHVTVRDTGPGISAENLKRVFTPFFQVEERVSAPADGLKAGLGLGLATGRRLANLLGGNLAVSSKAGHGSTFWLDLPAERTVQKPTQLSPEEVKFMRQQNDNPHRKRVLLVEDSPDAMLLMKRFLAKFDSEVLSAENGSDALHIVRSAREKGTPIDLILMDMQLPSMNGFQATRLLREDGFANPIIAVTAHTLAGDREKCLGFGCSDYMAKPIQSDLLRTKLQFYGLDNLSPRPPTAAV